MRRVIARAATALPVIGLGGLMVLAGPTSSAAAAGVATVTVNPGTPQVNCSGGQCEYYSQNCSVTVTNLTSADESVAVSSPTPTVLSGALAWSAANGDSGSVNGDTGVFWPGAVNGYAVILPGASITTTNCTFFPIAPQEATNATLSITVPVYPGDYPTLGTPVPVTGSAVLLQNGTPLPASFAVAGPAVAAALGVVLLLVQRRRRRA